MGNRLELPQNSILERRIDLSLAFDDQAFNRDSKAVHEALRTLRNVGSQLSRFEMRERALESVEETDFYLRNDGCSKDLAEIAEVERVSRPCFDILFRACAWLTPSTKDMVVDIASAACQRLSRACEKAVQAMTYCASIDHNCLHFQEPPSRMMQRALLMLAECCRWDAVSYRDIASETRQGLADCYRYARKTHCCDTPQLDSDIVLKSIDAAYLYATLLQNFDFSGLRRSEIVKVDSAIRKIAGGIPVFHSALQDGGGTIDIHIPTGVMSVQSTAGRAPQDMVCFSQLDLQSLFCELGLVLEATKTKRCRRWFVDQTRRFSSQGRMSSRGNTKQPANETCELVMNYLPVRNNLRDAKKSCGRPGTIVDITVTGCCISFAVADYQRPAVGRLISLSGPSIVPHVGIVRWISNAATESRKFTTIGIEFIGTVPRVVPAKSACQWPSGLFIEAVICVTPIRSDSSPPLQAAAVRMIQPINSHLMPRLIWGSQERNVNSVKLLEQGLDFDLVDCS